MRVSVVTTWFPTTRSAGAGSYVARDAQALAVANDVELVHLVPPRWDDGRRRFEHAGVPVRRIPVDVRTPLGLLSATRNLGLVLAGRDLVHTMAAPALLPFLVRRPSIPWIHTEHWSGVAKLSGRPWAYGAVRPLGRRAFSGPTEVVAVSEYLAASVRRFRAGPVTVIGNIVDAPPFAQRRRPTDDGRLRVIGVSTVTPNKGWRVAVEAVAAVRARGHDAELVWLGDGPDLEELRRIGANVLVQAPGRVDRAELAQELADADVFVLPTQRETFSLATVEALAAGLPVVATGEGAHVSFVARGVGEVVPRRADAVADGILRAARLDRNTVREHGARLVRRFGEEHFRKAYAEVYERVAR